MSMNRNDIFSQQSKKARNWKNSKLIDVSINTRSQFFYTVNLRQCMHFVPEKLWTASPVFQEISNWVSAHLKMLWILSFWLWENILFILKLFSMCLFQRLLTISKYLSNTTVFKFQQNGNNQQSTSSFSQSSSLSSLHSFSPRSVSHTLRRPLYH